MHKLIHRIFSRLPTMMISLYSCFVYGDSIPASQWDTYPVNYPLYWNEVRAKNYSLNNSFVFTELDFIDHDNPDINAVTSNLKLLRGPGWEGGINTQMRIRCPKLFNGKDAYYLYSRQDAEYPIIVIPAEETEIRIRVLPDNPTDSIPMELLGINIRDAKRSWMAANKELLNNYAYKCDNEWFQLTFPENRSNEFKEVGVSIITRQSQPPRWPYSTPGKIARNWIFIQLPWTLDKRTLDDVPLTTLQEYSEATVPSARNTTRPHCFPDIGRPELNLKAPILTNANTHINKTISTSFPTDSMQNLCPFTQAEVLLHTYGILHPAKVYWYMPWYYSVIPDSSHLESYISKLQSLLQVNTDSYIISELKFDNLPSTQILY